jgi:hypothetical protein
MSRRQPSHAVPPQPDQRTAMAEALSDRLEQLRKILCEDELDVLDQSEDRVAAIQLDLADLQVKLAEAQNARRRLLIQLERDHRPELRAQDDGK